VSLSAYCGTPSAFGQLYLTFLKGLEFCLRCGEVYRNVLRTLASTCFSTIRERKRTPPLCSTRLPACRFASIYDSADNLLAYLHLNMGRRLQLAI
jgi:hypothetical protein